MKLTDAKIKTARPTPNKTIKLSDGGGLQLHVTSSGSKLWKHAYRYNGKQKKLSYGAYPIVSLADAREKWREAKKMLAEGKDPSSELKAAKIERQIAEANTFGIVAKEHLEKRLSEDIAPATYKKNKWLLMDLASDLHRRPLKEIKPIEILNLLKSVEAKGNYETARRLKSSISQVFRYGIATLRMESDPTRDLQGALKTQKVKHRAAIVQRDEFIEFIKDVWEYNGTPSVSAGLKLMTLLFSRPGELRFSEWDDFDLEKRIWKIPVEKDKLRRGRKKPLSSTAISILQDLRMKNENSNWVMASEISRNKPISENTLNQALRRIGYSKDQATAHGFRASASSLLNESKKWSPDAIERELGHVEKNSVRRAYDRSEYWDERVRMSEWWAGEIDEMLKS